MFDPIEDALADLKLGKAIVVVDDENRENEGDLICAAEFATPEMINFMAVEARGLICLSMTGERLDELDIPLMVTNNTDPNQTAFTVSVDASPKFGVSTGISAEDRSRTIQVILDENTQPADLRRPGHIFPLRAKDGGVLKRAGHTEAAVDLSRLAGLAPAGVICEIQNPDGTMSRLPELIEYAQEQDLKLISIADLISYRLKHERFVEREAVTRLPSQFGQFDVYAYRNRLDDTEHIAIVKGDPATFQDEPIMVRVHSECLTGDALGSMRCDCRGQLQAALKMIEHAGKGVVVYLRQEGRGIGLVNKLKAYSLQDLGMDTVEANEHLGFAADLRDYGVGAQILSDLGVRQLRLITNNPRKIAGLKGYGLEMVDRVPLLIEANPFNSAYLTTKAEKLGHLFMRSSLLTLAVRWQDQPHSLTERYERLEKLRFVARECGLMLKEETRPVASALLGQASLIVTLGTEQSIGDNPNWYANPEHPYHQAVRQLLIYLINWEHVDNLSFLLAGGSDPLSGLQVQIDRTMLPLEQLSTVKPDIWQLQVIYCLSKTVKKRETQKVISQESA
ncbi:bifunctional 3,4-dihydroxy-2-butanone-4-phosphate synthase RibB/GTP cyclohydrolase II RibA [filamentous cyanobacterium LEGE 11480]|uniref:Riboflavin biosynthesis protein RibBA n=1 Tax=Romeriopsis navalis LEGE 11480 TaxID=2777977 RepID=A0A928VMN7_9CYAN|nr:bifunctional 3,4-dihydroxy-2-butanone-4-phosphate synthase/GTP cyclohydrolase II [Romeriopsis navalis]MBE9028784.1 bifunctional 3,4-dihydroxy-2-butanone-4-phosphate synthase RibB/GTP cyclohydrolase II RibA [Romeriopsis navalis LEGE 11480]